MQSVWQPGSWGMCSWPYGLRASCSLTSSTAFCSALWKVQAPQQALFFVPSFVQVLIWIPGAGFRSGSKIRLLALHLQPDLQGILQQA